VGDFEAWVAKAIENAGSWWPHWQKWVERQDSVRVPSRKPGEHTGILGDAPGTYVRVRV
jgi:polyhydroxyalkanoate synthase